MKTPAVNRPARRHVEGAVIGAGFVLAACGVCILLGLSVHHSPTPIKGGIVTTGRIVAVHTVTGAYNPGNNNAPNVNYTNTYPIIAFTDQHGSTHRFEASVANSSPIGTLVKVRYDPTNPARAQWVDEPGGSVWLVLVILPSVVAVLIVGALFVRVGRRRRRQRASRDAGWRLRATDALNHQWDDPSEELLRQVIAGLTATNDSLVIEHRPDDSAGGTYIQTAILNDGRFTVEYQDGDIHHHYHAEVDNADRACDVVAAWAFEHAGWRQMLPWQAEDLG